jgi:phospholipid/cholesterol/gamma-HCH transport system substrate-binding protein
MAQRQTVAWKELKVGLLVIVSFALLAAGIFFVGGETSFFTDQITIIAYFPDGNGLLRGAEVFLDGIRVGNVSKVALAENPGPNHLVDVTLRIDKQYENLIRTDSTVGIGSKGLLDDKTVEITRGTEKGDPLSDGDALQGMAASDIKRAITSANDVMANLTVLTQSVVDLVESVHKGEGTLGKLLTNTEIHDNMNLTVLEAKSLLSDVRNGSGNASKLIYDDEMYRRVNGLLSRVDELVVKVESGDGTLGRLINDRALYDRSEQLLGRVESIAARMDRGEGTAGKLLTDETLFNDTRAAINRVNTLLNRIENGDGTVGRLIQDPTLFNTINQTMSEIQKLLYDVRQDPKKYLTINFRLL